MLLQSLSRRVVLGGSLAGGAAFLLSQQLKLARCESHSPSSSARPNFTSSFRSPSIAHLLKPSARASQDDDDEEEGTEEQAHVAENEASESDHPESDRSESDDPGLDAGLNVADQPETVNTASSEAVSEPQTVDEAISEDSSARESSGISSEAANPVDLALSPMELELLYMREQIHAKILPKDQWEEPELNPDCELCKMFRKIPCGELYIKYFECLIRTQHNFLGSEEEFSVIQDELCFDKFQAFYDCQRLPETKQWWIENADRLEAEMKEEERQREEQAKAAGEAASKESDAQSLSLSGGGDLSASLRAAKKSARKDASADAPDSGSNPEPEAADPSPVATDS